MFVLQRVTIFSCTLNGLFVVVHSLGSIVLLGEPLVSEELRVHALGVGELGALGLLDAVGERLLRGVVVAGVF